MPPARPWASLEVQLSPDQIIAGKYRLNQLLGTGGMAQVWSAINTFTERQFAIKFMLPSMARTPEAAQRFLMEAKASARINHPNIVEIMDVGQTEEGALFLVMELLSGVSLETALKRQNPPMTVYELTVIMLDVARALQAAHRAGVVHRDLKPTNVFLHKDRLGIAVPKLLDFGVSKFHDEGHTGLTVAGTVLGSPLYMSPEQAMGAPNVDGRTDVFAFGGILFEALTGFRCYDAPNFNALIVTIATTQPRSIDEVAPHLPDSLRALVRDCLVTDRQKRIATFEEVVERLALVASILEHDPMRLPPPLSKGPPSDPDATSALPAVVRASDRPPSLTTTGIRVPSGNFSAPWTPPQGSLTPAPMRTAPPQNLIIGLGVAASVLAISLLAVAISRSGGANTRSIPPASAAVTSVHVAGPPPSVQVEALPTAKGRGVGTLVVVGQPQPCALSVNGAPLGSTPLSTQLSVGEHTLKCDFPGGRSKTTKVQVADSQTTRHVLSPD